MGENSKISWTHHTFNAWWGCDEVSPACDHCYAREFSKYLGMDLWGIGASRRFFGDKHWNDLRRWNRRAERDGERRRVFAFSMADIGEDRRELVEPRNRFFREVDECPWLDFLLLTKRPRALLRHLPTSWRDNPRSNVWFGFTAETQLWFERRLEEFLKIPAGGPVFISFEPLLGFIDPGVLLPLNLRWWFLVGGESAKRRSDARPMHPAWARHLRDYAITRGIPFHFKQWGEWAPGECVERRRGYVPTATWFDKRWLYGRENLASEGGHIDDEPDLYCVGVKEAGHHLDGQEWLEVPRAAL